MINSEDSALAKIFKQLPVFRNNQARLGSSIDIWLTTDSLKLFYADSTQLAPDSIISVLDSISTESTNE